LNEISNCKVDPCDFTCHERFSINQAIKFRHPWPDLIWEVFLSSLKSGISVMAIAQSHELNMSISEDSPNSCHCNFFLNCSSRQLWLVGFEANIDANCITLAN
jgi:hypothetical protein